MRVIAGTAGGRKLEAPDGLDTRPTTDRVREAVFNVLFSRVDLEGCAVVDLFAGTGAYGIEALSRGAEHATFVERDRRAIELIRRNLDTLGFTDQAAVVQADALTWVKGGRQPIPDVVFCDPPYVFDAWSDLLAPLHAHLVVVESDGPIDLPEGWLAIRTKRYGGTVVTLSQRDEPETVDPQGADEE